MLADGRVLDVANVVVHRLPAGVRLDRSADFRSRRLAAEMRGVVPDAPGLFFCGLAFQYAFSSTVLAGVGRDAAYVAEQIEVRSEVPRARSLSLVARNL